MNNRDKDMYLPVWVLGLGVVFLVGALICLVLTFTASIFSLIGFVICMGFGTAAVLCWKNQWAIMVDQDSFVYSTMFGKKKQYHFSDIKELKPNSDSVSLVCEDGKIHIERCAIMSDRFITAIDSILEKKSWETAERRIVP